MGKSLVDDFRRKREVLSRPRERGAEHIGHILPGVLHAIAQRVVLDVGVTRESFLGQTEQSLDALLRKAKETDGKFNCRTVLEVIFAWVKDEQSARLRIRAWLNALPSKVWKNQRQSQFLQGLKDTLDSFTEEQGELFPV